MTLYALPPVAPTSRQAPAVTVTTTAPVIKQQVSVTPVASRSDLLVETAEWSWQELRDYVVSQIEKVSGPFPRDSRKEYGIFNRFLKTYGQDAIAVARYAFEVGEGWWNGAPISINRFAKGSDPYFVLPILDRLRVDA